VPLPAPTGVGMGTAVGEAPEVGTFSSVLQFGTGLAKALSKLSRLVTSTNGLAESPNHNTYFAGWSTNFV
jgi:hypothetical protein